MQSNLGIHSLTNYTYGKQQLIEEAIYKCTCKNQLLEWYDNVNIHTVNLNEVTRR